MITRDLASLAKSATIFEGKAEEKLSRLRAELAPLAARYDFVVANPPYMGGKNMNRWLGAWVRKNYPDVKGDLFSCFIVRNAGLGADHAQLGFMTPYVWMFIGTYEKLRRFVIEQCTITSLIQLEYSGFAGATVPICTFTLQKGCEKGYRGGYIRLSDFVGADNQAPRVLEALADPGCGWFYRRDASAFGAIPGSPIAYWLSDSAVKSFSNALIGNLVDSSTGMKTGDNERFLRLWWEVSISTTEFESRSADDAAASGRKWFPYNKGGDYRKWYGNDDTLINWMNDGYEIKNPPQGITRHYQLVKREWMFKPLVTWTKISSSDPCFRIKDYGQLYDMAGASLIPTGREQSYVLVSLCNSSVARTLLRVLAPTLNYQSGDIAKLPIINDNARIDTICIVVSDCVELSKHEWDTNEISWCFTHHPLV